MLDSRTYNSKERGVYFDCIANRGISAGWADGYGKRLDYQYVDITGLPSGHYTLEVEVNSDRVLPESNYRNNSTTVPVKGAPLAD